MKIKGIVSIVIADIGGSIKQQVTQENLIFDASWLGILGNNVAPLNPGYNYFGSRNISIAQDTSTPIASDNNVTDVIGTAAPVLPSPVWVEDVDPPYGTITGRINPVGVSRTFTSVALTGLTPADVQTIPSEIAYARLLLTTVCTQEENDFVNITYTIQFLDNVGDGFLSKDLNRYDLGRSLFGFGNYNIGILNTCWCDPYTSSIELPPASTGITITTGAVSTDPENYKWNYQYSQDRDTGLGVIYNALTQGVSNEDNRVYALTQYLYDLEPFQTGFKKSSLSVVPFFDSANFGSSQGTAIFEGTWTKKIPEIYKILFTATGATGVATYKFSVLKHTGFRGNTYTPLDNKTLYRTPGYQFVNNLHGWRVEDFDVHRLSETEIVQFDLTGVSQIDIFNGTNKTWDSTTTPALSVTNTRQIAVDITNRLIYVACRDTGLWIINIGANTVTQQFNDPCYGVDVGRSNIAIALIDGGIYLSSNWVTPEPFTFVGITDGNWDRVRFLKADPVDTDDQIAIVADNGSGTNRIVWYQFSDNSAVLGYEDASVNSYPASLDVSDIGSLWIVFRSIDASKIIYGTNTLDATYDAYYRNFTHSVWGLDNFSKVTFYKDNYIGYASLQGGSDTVSYNKFNFATERNNAFVLHLEGGVVLSDQSFENIGGLANIAEGLVVQLFPSIAEISYGWNGSTWVEGNINSKTTHASAEVLLNGLTVRFANGTNPPHFINTEFFTQSINYGLLKDNATSIEIRTAWYSKAIHNETIASTTITSTVTLPADGNPIFRRVDLDEYYPHRIYINGVLVTKLWLDGTAPAVSEASFPADGSAVLTFNTLDLGKTLTGSYVWIEV